MRYKSILLLIFSASLFACVTDPNLYSGTTLDDLDDKENYTEGMFVACYTYRGEAVEKVVVNGTVHNDPEVIQLIEPGYYRIEISQGKSYKASIQVIRIVILDPERGTAEWGLPPWTPLDPENGELGEQVVKLLHAPSVPLNMAIPLVVLIGEELTFSESYLDAEIGGSSFRIKRGVGSVQMPANSTGDALMIDHRNFLLNIDSIDTPPRLLSGVLATDLHIPAGSYIHIADELTIPAGITLTIGSGSFISIAPEVNILNNGLFYLAGTSGAPVTLTCSDSEAYWGGMIGTLAGNRVDATYTIFSRSGYHTGGEYSYGHAGRQALFYSENGELKLDHCYMIDHIGQVFYPVSCTLDLTDCLVQRAKTGGQINESELVMNRCVFTDFPDDSFEYRDEDNDGLYLNRTNAVISNSVFMFAKDDGLDSGASGGGEVLISNSRFEANFHEGAALSSGYTVDKLHRITSSVFTNCGQGLELGYSSPNHMVEVDSCRFIGNGIGIRYGDCYESRHQGYIHVSNSESLENSVYDVWNMNRDYWAADTFHMSFENVHITKPNPMYPELITNE
jgi:hypothetical protein